MNHRVNDKRLYGTLIAALCGLAAASIGVCSNCTGVFYTPVSEELGLLRGSFAFHATLTLLATAGISPAMRGLMKKVPYRMLLIIGLGLSVGSTAAMAFSRSLWLFYALSILRGLGVGMFANVPLTIIVNNWFHEKHGIVSGVMLSFSGVAGALCSPLLAKVIAAWSWQTAYLLSAAIMALFTLPALFLIPAAKPEDVGYRLYGIRTAAVTCKTSNFRYSDPVFLCLCVIALLHPAITGIAQHFTGYAVTIGMTAETGALMMSLSMAGNIVMKLIIGVLSDRIGAVKACLSMILLNVLSLFLIRYSAAAGSVQLLCIAAFLYGSVYAVGAVGISLLCRSFFGTERYARAYIVIGPIISVGAAVSLPLIGYLYDFTGSYDLMLLAALIIHAVDITILALALRLRARGINKEESV